MKTIVVRGYGENGDVELYDIFNLKHRILVGVNLDGVNYLLNKGKLENIAIPKGIGPVDLMNPEIVEGMIGKQEMANLVFRVEKLIGEDKARITEVDSLDLVREVIMEDVKVYDYAGFKAGFKRFAEGRE